MRSFALRVNAAFFVLLHDRLFDAFEIAVDAL